MEATPFRSEPAAYETSCCSRWWTQRLEPPPRRVRGYVSARRGRRSVLRSRYIKHAGKRRRDNKSEDTTLHSTRTHPLTAITSMSATPLLEVPAAPCPTLTTELVEATQQAILEPATTAPAPEPQPVYQDNRAQMSWAKWVFIRPYVFVMSYVLMIRVSHNPAYTVNT